MSSAGISDGRNELGFHFSVGLLEESPAMLAACASPDVRLAGGIKLVVLLGMGMGDLSPSFTHICS